MFGILSVRHITLRRLSRSRVASQRLSFHARTKFPNIAHAVRQTENLCFPHLRTVRLISLGSEYLQSSCFNL